MEELFGMLIMYIGCCLSLLFVAIIMCFAHELDHKIKMWLTDRALKKKFGDKWLTR